MKLIVAKRGIPRCFSRHPAARGVVAERDLTITRRGRLAAKLLVFRRQLDLAHFWNKGLHSSIGPRCRGVVHALCHEVITIKPGKPERRHIAADPRYYCVIGLLQGHLTMEVICHESVHVGFAHAKRIRRTPWDELAKEFDEEAIAYPTGAIASAINRALWDAGLFKPEQVGVEA